MTEYEWLFRRCPQPMWVYDVDSLRFLDVNDAAVDRYGFAREQFLAMTIFDIRPEADADVLRERLATVGRGAAENEIWRHRTKDGDVFEVDIVARPVPYTGHNAAFVMAIDVSERVETQRRLQRLAYHDNLTGLPNRTKLMEELADALQAATRPDSVAVIFLDVDRFKVVNDGLGHAAGDQLLTAIGSRVRNTLRQRPLWREGVERPALLARIGGDEFVVALFDLPERAVAEAVAERIGWTLEQPFGIGGQEFCVTASQGVAFAEIDDGPQELVARADAAMYRAKELGRSRVYVAHHSTQEAAAARFQLEHELRQALDNDELVLHYQPVVSVGRGVVVGAEALVRWQHPERGLLGPDHFIPLAEEAGLIAPIGEWVLRSALAEAARWPVGESGPLSISVNVSAHQLRVPNLPFVVARGLSSAGVAPARLHLEITESALMGDPEQATSVLKSLRELGVRIDVDDFGTGYSSLSYVQRLPVDTLKIDKSFLHQRDDDDTALITAIITLGRSLGLDVIAEGVETLQHRELLHELGCPHAQGYHYARPMAAQQFLDLVSDPLQTSVQATRRRSA